MAIYFFFFFCTSAIDIKKCRRVCLAERNKDDRFLRSSAAVCVFEYFANKRPLKTIQPVLRLVLRSVLKFEFYPF